MKSEERHQLLTNDLGVVTNKTVGFFERHLEATIAAVCAVLVIGAVVVWWNSSAVSESSAGWTALDSAKSLQDFGAVADKFKGKAPGQWAALHIAEKTCQDAMPLMFTNREVAKSELKSAREGFEGLAKDKSAPPVIRERALWGLALCAETLCEGDTSKAMEAYESLITNFPETIFKQAAEERIASLKKGDAKDFYEWFAKENPKPVEARPDEFNKKSDANSSSPKFNEEDMKLDDSEEKTAQPAADDKPKDDTKSAENSDQKPVEPAKPVEGEKAATGQQPQDGQKPPVKK